MSFKFILFVLLYSSIVVIVGVDNKQSILTTRQKRKREDEMCLALDVVMPK